jgi:hypothetical protein
MAGIVVLAFDVGAARPVWLPRDAGQCRAVPLHPGKTTSKHADERSSLPWRFYPALKSGRLPRQ